ncbi:hypothetical protein J1N09_06275 [Aureitalea sp. L0-47]|uniref:DUF7486 family protein n=1 Tax=Aureitalea sp. L0-47 TaxID=2816962 RepID=UPI002237AE65|nr:hypothetical protein [Aureitalea sp. L0-47]MCW5519435.1 hypothetical protein [Aureitalea sp. L0-47]
MKTFNIFLVFSLIAMLQVNAQIPDKDQESLIKPEVEISTNIFWQVKAYHPDVKLLKVKAFDGNGNIYDVKAIQGSDDTSLLNVKAIVDGKYLPIKLIMIEGDRYHPLKAITEDGMIMDVRAITEEGFKLPIKGVSKTGNIIHLRAIDDGLEYYNIISISPFGDVNQVKGLKMMDSDVEATINGVKIYAHVKAIKISSTDM